MNINEIVMSNPCDHIMANTWRLIFERNSRSSAAKPLPQPVTDFSLLEQLLPEYRLIGLSLADNKGQRRCN